MSDITAASVERTNLWGRGAKAFLALLLLIATADFLFWPAVPGISIAIFMAAVAVPIVWLRRERINSRAMLSGLGIFALG
ncbi:MAG TPA: hypothetical protein VIN06_11655, partial [Devosia sp.]